MRRIEEATKYVPIENLTLSPQCGFASVDKGNFLSWDEQRREAGPGSGYCAEGLGIVAKFC